MSFGYLQNFLIHTSSYSLPITPNWYLILVLAAALSWYQLLYHVIAAPELRFTGMSVFTAWLTANISVRTFIHDLQGRFLTMYGSSASLSWSVLAPMSSMFLQAFSSKFPHYVPSMLLLVSALLPLLSLTFHSLASTFFLAPSGPPEDFDVKPLRGKGTAVMATWDEPEEPNGRIRGQVKRVEARPKQIYLY